MYLILTAEVDRLAETTRKMFSLSPLPEDFNIDENDFVHGLPKEKFHSILSFSSSYVTLGVIKGRAQ